MSYWETYGIVVGALLTFAFLVWVGRGIFFYLFPETIYSDLGAIDSVWDQGSQWDFSTVRVDFGPRWNRRSGVRTIVRRDPCDWCDLETMESLPMTKLLALEKRFLVERALRVRRKGFFDEQ